MATSGATAREIGCKGMGNGEGSTETDGLGEPELFRSELRAVWSGRRCRDTLGDVRCNLQPARYERCRKMCVRVMTATITVLGGGGLMLTETVKDIGLEDGLGDGMGDGLGKCNLQSERHERWRKMHGKPPV